MSYRFITATGQIDEAAVLEAVNSCDAARRYRTGQPLPPDERASMAEFYRQEASRERARFNGHTEDEWIAAHCFVIGALDGLTGERALRIEAHEGPDVHIFERQQHCQAEISRIQSQRRRDTFARCLAALDRSLNRIRRDRGITRFLQAGKAA